MIRWVKKLARGSKIGHTGTLDPLASGLMILLFGKATKHQASFMGMDKRYRCRVKLGVKTNSGDITGAVISTQEPPPIDQSRLDEALARFTGAISQEPPMYSAVKVGGVPLYKLARKGKTVERTARTVTIHELRGAAQAGELDLSVHCSSGTYVRTLAEGIAEALGTVGTVSSLVRESIGPHSVEQALAGERLKDLDESGLQSRLVGVA
jgi:tRNA pseudouridine55 synthase